MRARTAKQIKQIAKSIRAFGFVNPVIIDSEGRIVAGHGRVEAARRRGLNTVPVICLAHLTKSELRAYAIADNRLAELAGWDREVLALEFADLVTIDSDFDVSVTGFDLAEIDLAIQEKAPDDADDIPEAPQPTETITRTGDLWCLGEHRILCADVRNRSAVWRLMAGCCIGSVRWPRGWQLCRDSTGDR
jgi:ParB-like chromosome segregation protein Spo0J